MDNQRSCQLSKFCQIKCHLLGSSKYYIFWFPQFNSYAVSIGIYAHYKLNVKCFMLVKMKVLIMSESFGNKVLDTQPTDKQTLLLEVSLLFKKSRDLIRLSRYDPDFDEYVTIEDNDIASLKNKDKLKLDISAEPVAQPAENVIANIAVPIPPEGGVVNLPVAVVPSSDTEEGDCSFNTSNLSTSTAMNDR